MVLCEQLDQAFGAKRVGLSGSGIKLDFLATRGSSSPGGHFTPSKDKAENLHI